MLVDSAALADRRPISGQIGANYPQCDSLFNQDPECNFQWFVLIQVHYPDQLKM